MNSIPCAVCQYRMRTEGGSGGEVVQIYEYFAVVIQVRLPNVFHLTLSVIPSRKHCRLPKPSAERHTLSPVPVHDRQTMSSCNHFRWDQEKVLITDMND